MMRRLRQLLTDEHGAVSAEYAVVAALIAGVIVLAVTQFGQSVKSLFEKTDAAMPGAN